MLCIERVEFYVSIVTWMTCLYLLSIVSSSHKKADKLIFAQKARMAYLSHFLNLRVCVEYKPDTTQIGDIIINNKQNNTQSRHYDINNDDVAMKSLFFILTCLQTSYPDIYQNLSYNSIFVTKIEKIAQKIPIEDIINTKTEELPNILKEKEATWEADLYNICQTNDFNKNHFLRLLSIFMFIKNLSMSLSNKYTNLNSPLSMVLNKTDILMNKHH